MTILQIAFVGHDQELNSDRILEARSPPAKRKFGILVAIKLDFTKK